MMKPKLVIINRAVPGSGKTTALKTIEVALKEEELDISRDFAVHSTDTFFMVGEKYIFDIEKLNDYHRQNEINFEHSLKSGISVVVCDNTNILPWQCEVYTNLARKYNYKIAFLNIEPKSLDEHIETQKVTPENPSAHQVPEEVLQRNIEEWRIYNDLFQNGRRVSINPLRHKHFVWDNENLCRVDTGIMARHFDCDYLISLPSWWDKIELQKELRSVIRDQIPWRFDCVIHTCDKTDAMLLVWGFTTFLADRHIVLYSKDMSDGFINSIKKEFACSTDVETCRVDHFDIESIEKIMREKVRCSQNSALHLSGGSKVMFLAGQNVARDLRLRTFVVDTYNFHLLSLNDCKPVKKIASLSKVNDFLAINTYGLRIIADTNVKDIEKRKELNCKLFNHCREVIKITQKIQQKIDNEGYDKVQNKSFKESVGELSIEYNQTTLEIRITKDSTYLINDDPVNCLSYILGGWFEEYIYLELISLLESGYIYDLQINAKLNTDGVDYQEFDIIFTDGYRLFVIECKSGGVRTKSVEKLANIKQRYGGINAICVIVTPFGQNSVVDMKVKENGLYLVQGNHCRYIKEIIQGHIYQ
ncbi:Card1-like endonuclease domain-containing protein [Helicobacter trogontum]|uniref:DUF1887 family protein n=1 Tax=Helicobacter trogontum TaxID=50960 RepID=A0A4U8TI40_9HELI|nr:DUF1887 family CARF protein [Helicobacter trogontum]TLD99374.1 DUF1887 family protein [Helicobacter trogontum]